MRRPYHVSHRRLSIADSAVGTELIESGCFAAAAARWREEGPVDL
jgi:hypothetical protein